MHVFTLVQLGIFCWLPCCVFIELQEVGLERTLRASLVIFLLMAGVLKLFLPFFLNYFLIKIIAMLENIYLDFLILCQRILYQLVFFPLTAASLASAPLL